MRLNKLVSIGILLMLSACDDAADKPEGNKNNFTENKPAPAVGIDFVEEGYEFTTEKEVDYDVRVLKNEDVDSVTVSLNGVKLKGEKGKLNLDSLPLGENTLKTKAYLKNKKVEVQSRSFLKLSSYAPLEYDYKIINTFKHNEKDYTQGLEVIDGIVYEGTGMRGESKLKVWELNTGKVIQEIDLEPSFFGEGITVLKDKIYQLSWQSHTGFVYDKSTLKRVNSFTYPNEGWGLTNDGQYLIMSDGTNVLTYINPQSFEIIKKVQVFDDVSGVYDLNELEYIKGEIYANVYRTDLIVIIDPSTGAVKGRIDFSGILNNVEVKDEVDVFNGIAFDKVTQKIYVTGKWWPALFEVKTKEVKGS